jgi:hypothetical protein
MTGDLSLELGSAAAVPPVVEVPELALGGCESLRRALAQSVEVLLFLCARTRMVGSYRYALQVARLDVRGAAGRHSQS